MQEAVKEEGVVGVGVGFEMLQPRWLLFMEL